MIDVGVRGYFKDMKTNLPSNDFFLRPDEQRRLEFVLRDQDHGDSAQDLESRVVVRTLWDNQHPSKWTFISSFYVPGFGFFLFQPAPSAINLPAVWNSFRVAFILLYQEMPSRFLSFPPFSRLSRNLKSCYSFCALDPDGNKTSGEDKWWMWRYWMAQVHPS